MVIVDERGDLDIFESPQAAASYLEAVDVMNGEFVIYDEDGRVFVATDPASRRAISADGTQVVTGMRDGVEVRVVVGADGNIVTGYPTNLPRNP